MFPISLYVGITTQTEPIALSIPAPDGRPTQTEDARQHGLSMQGLRTRMGQLTQGRLTIERSETGRGQALRIALPEGATATVPSQSLSCSPAPPGHGVFIT